MAIADTITSMQNHISNAYTMIGYGTDLTGINKNLENLSSTIFDAFLEALKTPSTLFNNLPKITGSGSNITLNNTANAPMRIELGATELTQDGTPTPSTPYPIHIITGSNKIVILGSQLFDKDSITNNYYYNENGNYVAVNETYISDYIEVKENESYTLQTALASTTKRINYFDSNKTWLSQINTGNANLTFTTPNNTKYIRVSFNQAVNKDNIMINYGSTATTYTPYVSQEADIDLKSKNLFNREAYQFLNISTTRVGNNTSIPLKAGTYTISYTGGNQLYYLIYDSGGTKISESNWESGNVSFTLANDYSVQFRIRKTGDATITAGEITNVMINAGSTALPYVPYYDYGFMGSIGNYENKPIRTSGKNILSGVEQGTLDSSGQPTSSTTAIRSKNYDLVEPSTQYTFSMNGTSGGVNVAEYTSNKTFISYTFSGGTFTTSATTRYIKISKTGTTNDLYQINKGSTALPYEPYGSNEWYLKKNIGKNQILSTDYLVYDNINLVFYDKNFEGLYNASTTPYCNYLEGVSSVINNGSAHNTGNNKCCFRSETTDRLYFTRYDITSLEDFKTWLDNIDLYVYYVLSTPTYTPITGTLAEQLEYVYQMLKSQKGQTNISQVNNDLPFVLDVEAIEEI